MPANEDLTGTLDRSLTQCGRLIANVKPDQADLPTPCASWDLRALVNHIVFDVRMFTETTQGNERPPADQDLIGDDWSGAYDVAAAGLLDVWQRPGALEGTFTTPMGELPKTWRIGQQISDLVVHAWDVAKATGESDALDPDTVAFALDWGTTNLKPEYRGPEGSGKQFGEEVPVPEDAPPADRVAGLFGRDPAAWS